MEIWEKYKFNSSEYKVWEIYKAYEVAIKNRGDFRKYLPVKTDPRTGKNWTYFEQAYKRFEKDTMFNPHIFIEAQFRNIQKDKSLFPAQLKTKVAENKYREHLQSLKMVDTTDQTKQMMINLANTFMFMKKWWKQNDHSKHSYSAFFEKEENEMMSIGMIFCMQGLISKYYMALSRSFMLEYNNLDPDTKYEIIEPKELQDYRIKIKLDEDAYDFAKEIFLGDVR